MKKLFDHHCVPCDIVFEALAEGESPAPCVNCGEPAPVRVTGGHTFTVIQATSLTSGRYKAGYIHKFQKRDAEKISVQVASPVAKP